MNAPNTRLSVEKPCTRNHRRRPNGKNELPKPATPLELSPVNTLASKTARWNTNASQRKVPPASHGSLCHTCRPKNTPHGRDRGRNSSCFASSAQGQE